MFDKLTPEMLAMFEETLINKTFPAKTQKQAEHFWKVSRMDDHGNCTIVNYDCETINIPREYAGVLKYELKEDYDRWYSLIKLKQYFIKNKNDALLKIVEEIIKGDK